MREASLESTATVLGPNQLCRSCSSCTPHKLCLPAGIGVDDLSRLDATVKGKRMLDRGATLYRDGDMFDALYVVRSGSLKTFAQNEASDVQILAFHLPGEIIGFDALATNQHVSQAEARHGGQLTEVNWHRPYRRTNKLRRKPSRHARLPGSGTA